VNAGLWSEFKNVEHSAAQTLKKRTNYESKVCHLFYATAVVLYYGAVVVIVVCRENGFRAITYVVVDGFF